MAAYSFDYGSSMAVIPARGGSKGLRRKALREVDGVPLLSRAVKTVKASVSVGRVIVSTDDAEFAELARSEGAEIPFLRPPDMAGDSSPVTDAVVHLLGRLQDTEGSLPEFLLLCQSTSPFLTAADIDGAFAALSPNTDAVVSVCASEVMPDWLRVVNPEGHLEPFLKLDAPQHTARQKMREVYRLNGAVYWIRTSVFLARRTFLPPKTRPFVMPQERSVDVDNEFDLDKANFIASKYGF